MIGYQPRAVVSAIRSSDLPMWESIDIHVLEVNPGG